MVDVDTIRPAGRWDWWKIPLAWSKALPIGLPGVVGRHDGSIEVHRTHLPLLRERGFPVPELPDGPDVACVGDLEFRPWQRRAHRWARPRRGTVIVAEPRMGKTGLALSLHDPSEGPLVILAPLDVRQVWTDWVARLFPGLELTALTGRKVDLAAIRNADAIFAHYDIVAFQQVVGFAPATLIVDEAHLLANPRSKRSKGVRLFAGSAKRVEVLTGTPLWNSTAGLWPLVATANPGAWGPQPFAFQQRYCSPLISEYGWTYGEISNAEEWHARRAEVVFQADWMTEQPGLVIARRERVDVSLDASAIYDLDCVAEEIRNRESIDTMVGAIARYRHSTGRLKVEAVAAAAKARPGPIVVWAWHKEVARAIAEVTAQSRPTFTIHGDEKIDKRLAALAAWRQEPEGILCATLAVGQVGIDLSHAATAFFTEVDWTPAVVYQAMMRTFDASRPMEIVFFRVAHPVEQLLVDKLMTKLERGAAASMPAAGSGFDLKDAQEDPDALLGALDQIIASSSASF